jgi:TM2 domain-containing membrane protein YozV
MAVDNVALFQAIQARAIKELTPKLRVGPKSAFWIHTAINAILNIVYPKDKQDSYLKDYNTTLGFTVAMATSHGEDARKFGNWRTLCHEIKHVLQAMKWTRVIMGYLYLWPISQGILLALLAWIPVFWVPGWWKALYLGLWLVVTGVHFIPQLPDPWRKRWEFQAYSISMHLRYLIYGRIDQAYIDALVQNFHSMMYFIMAPNEKKIREELAKLATQIEMGDSPVKDEPIVIIAEEEYKRLAA